jgi:hypothetical protein
MSRTIPIRIVLTDAAAAEFARLQEERRTVTLTPDGGNQPRAAVRRAVPAREVYELIARAFLQHERVGGAIPILYPPDGAPRRLAWIDSDVKAELEAAAKRLDVSILALFYTATQAFLEGRLGSQSQEQTIS